MNVDSRGVARGCCNFPGCSCSCYAVSSIPGEMKCSKCYHPPGRHAKSSMTMPVPQSVSDESGSDSQDDNEPSPQPVPTITKIISSFTKAKPPQRESPHPRPRDDAWATSVPRPPSTKKQSLERVPTCIHPNCNKEAFFDLNTREESVYCNDHMHMPTGIVSPEDLHNDFSGAMFITDGDSDTRPPTSHDFVIPDQTQELTSLTSLAPSQIVFPLPMPAECSQTTFHPSQSTPNLSLQHQLPHTMSLPSAMPLAAMAQPLQIPVQSPQVPTPAPKPGTFSRTFTA